jgi:hypothetical protein
MYTGNRMPYPSDERGRGLQRQVLSHTPLAQRPAAVAGGVGRDDSARRRFAIGGNDVLTMNNTLADTESPATSTLSSHSTHISPPTPTSPLPGPAPSDFSFQSNAGAVNPYLRLLKAGILPNMQPQPGPSNRNPTMPPKDSLFPPVAGPSMQSTNALHLYLQSGLPSSYGIPNSLPPTPSTAPRSQLPSEPQPLPQEVDDAVEQLQRMSSGYMHMLSTQPQAYIDPYMSDNYMSALTAPVEEEQFTNGGFINPNDLFRSGPDTDAPADVCDVTPSAQGDYSPILSQQTQAYGSESASTALLDRYPFRDHYSQYEFTPEDDTPYEAFIQTPQDDSPFSEFLSTPKTEEVDLLTGPVPIDNLTLHGETSPQMLSDAKLPPLGIGKLWNIDGTAPAAPALDTSELYTMSPDDPSLDSFESNDTSVPQNGETHPQSLPILPLPSEDTSRVLRSYTGTRKNATVQSMIPIDAPTQPRNYLTPSATSRKAVPASFARKRKRSVAFAEDDEDDEDEEPTVIEMSKIEQKRRQNTIAARRSRQRKMAYQKELEQKVDELEKEVKLWKNRAQSLSIIAQSHNIPVPKWEDE